MSLVFRHEERERHTIFTMLTVPTSPHSQPPAGLLGPESKSQLTDSTNTHPVASNRTDLAQSQFSTNVFFEITKFSLPGMTSFTSQSHLLSGGFIMTFLIVISSTRERELYSMCAPALSRIVQNPTNPNDKI